MIHAQAPLCLVLFIVGPSAESRGHDSTICAVPIHFCSASSPEQDAPTGELHKEGNVFMI